MKTTNLSRKEAYKAMIDGSKVRHDEFLVHNKSYYFFDGTGFFIFDGNNFIKKQTILKGNESYYVYEPEPTFKEVTMYAPVAKGGSGLYYSHPRDSIDEALMEPHLVGYVEMKVFLKSEGEE